jgi:hypothetical protein
MIYIFAVRLYNKHNVVAPKVKHLGFSEQELVLLWRVERNEEKKHSMKLSMERTE